MTVVPLVMLPSSAALTMTSGHAAVKAVRQWYQVQHTRQKEHNGNKIDKENDNDKENIEEY